MRSKCWILTSQSILAAALIILISSNAIGQNDGSDDLDKAFDLKLNVKSTKDLDSVVKLCKTALEKGLDKEGEASAKQLAGSTLFEHANQLSQRIFANARDGRWRIYRSQALTRLRKAIEYQPEMAEAYLLIARLNGELEGGDDEEALEAIEKAVELAGDDDQQLSNALFWRAKLSDDPESQIADLNQSIQINPDNIDAVRRRADYYLMKRKPKDALPDLKKWLDADSKNVKNHIVAATSLMRSGKINDEEIQGETLDIIDSAIELAPDNSLPHTLRAQLNVFREKPDDAISDANRAIKLDRKNVDALMIRASILSEKTGEEALDSALEDVDSVLDIVPGYVRGIELRGNIYIQQQNFEKAIADFKLLAENEPQGQFYKRQLAILYNANEEPSRAIRIYKRLLDDSPVDDIDSEPVPQQIGKLVRRMATLRGIGDARLSVGDHELAVDNYQEAMELTDKIRELQDAEGVDELIKMDDGILNNLAWVLATSPLEEVRDGEMAIKHATQAAEITEFKEAHILSTLASGYAETGDFDKAIEWIEKAIEVNQENGKSGKVGEERTAEQRASLQKEFDSYKKKEPWRELQDVEKEKEEKLKKEKEDKKKKKTKKSESEKDEDKKEDEDEDKDDDN